MFYPYNLSNHNRCEYLRDLLTTVYGTTDVRYEIETECVVSRNSIFDSCNFKIRKSMGLYSEKFKELFDFTLLDDKFCFNSKKRLPALDRNGAMKNYQAYLEKIGVDLFEWEGIEIEKEKWSWLLYTTLALFIIPAIFFVEYKDRKSKDHKYDDIELQMKAAVVGIQRMFDRERIALFMENSRQKYVNSQCKVQECNYKLLIKKEEIKIPNMIKWECIETECCNECKIPDHPDKKGIKNELLDGFIKVDPNNEVIKIETNNLCSDEGYKINISSVRVNINIIPQEDFEYLTYIPKDDKKFYDNYKTNYQLKKAVIERAQYDIDYIFASQKYSYYLSISQYIEDVLMKISKINMDCFVNNNISDIAFYEETLRIFTYDSNEITEYYKDKYGMEGAKEKIKFIIIDMISRFSNQLEKVSEQLADIFHKTFSKEEFDSHKRNLEEYINKKDLKNNSIESTKNYFQESCEKFNEVVENYYKYLNI